MTAVFALQCARTGPVDHRGYSGYTRYMTANAKTLAHSQTIITELVKAIIQIVELPLEVAKLEGDAVFLFCRKSDGPQPWHENKRLIGQKLLTFFGIFTEKIALLSQSNTCTCHACTHIEQAQAQSGRAQRARHSFITSSISSNWRGSMSSSFTAF